MLPVNRHNSFAVFTLPGLLLMFFLAGSFLMACLLSLYLFFHYMTNSGTTSNRIWGYAKGQRLPRVSSVWGDTRTRSPFVTGSYEFYNYFPNNNYQIEYIINVYSASEILPSLVRPIIGKHQDEPLFSVAIEGPGLNETYTSDTIGNLQKSGALHGGLLPELGVIHARGVAKKYTLVPGRYKVTFIPNSEFINSIIPYQHLAFFTRFNYGDNRLVNFLLSAKRTSFFLPIMPLIWASDGLAIISALILTLLLRGRVKNVGINSHF